MTQQTLANHLYVTRQTVSRWECGSRYPDLLTAKKLASFLGVSLDELLSGDELQRVAEKRPVIENPGMKKILLILLWIYCVFFPDYGGRCDIAFSVCRKCGKSCHITAVIAGTCGIADADRHFWLWIYHGDERCSDACKNRGYPVCIFFNSVPDQCPAYNRRHRIYRMEKYCDGDNHHIPISPGSNCSVSIFLL